MFEAIIAFSVRQKALILVMAAALVGAGIYSAQQLPLDAVPDITNNQVQVVTLSPSLAPEEIEKFITQPLELQLGYLPNLVELRSLSRFGLSIITIVFEESVPILQARQLVQEQLNLAQEELPLGLGRPEMLPITTGLGEIYQYTLQVDSAYADRYSPTDLRTIQDWLVKRRFSQTEGLVEVSSFGGFLKEYEVAVDPLALGQFELSLDEVGKALEAANQNLGAGYLQRGERSFYLRTEGLLESEAEIESVYIAHRDGRPVHIRDVAELGEGHAPRFGAISMDGRGEVVGGITLMLRGANSSQVIQAVQERVAEIQKSLPEGVRIEAYLDRSELVGRAINTVRNNLLEGGLIVIFVLILFLGNLRAGFIVASVIPLSLFFAFLMMHLLGVSANLMSLGAIDFGIVIDGAVIIVEHSLFVLHRRRQKGQAFSESLIAQSASEIYRSAAFGVLIILVVFLPILLLEGVEGKMFRPMAMVFGFAISGALLLSLTYVPAISALAFRQNLGYEWGFSARLMQRLESFYAPILSAALKMPRRILALASLLLVLAVWGFSRMGQEFIPQLEEGDLAMQVALPTGSGLEQSLHYCQQIEARLLARFPEIEHVISKIGASEIPTDPMGLEEADIMIILKDKSDWVSADNREELSAQIKEALAVFPGLSIELTQPIQLRFNELLTGAKTDIAVKIFGPSPSLLARLGQKAEAIIQKVPGAADVKLEQTEGLPQIRYRLNREALAHFGVSPLLAQEALRGAYSGHRAGVIYEGEKRFDLVLRLEPEARQNPQLSDLQVRNERGQLIALSALFHEEEVSGPALISREQGQRRINVGVNVRGRDLASTVAAIEEKLASELALPEGYYLEYGGEFKNLESAKARLSWAVPAALMLIALLLYGAFQSWRLALLLLVAVPLSTIGGIAALILRDMPFSISAGVGFVTLFGVSVLNGIVLVNHFNQLIDKEGMGLREALIQGSRDRLRPVLITAVVAALGFLPMALSTTAGAEVQRPLATVVIGGIVSDTLLTLIVLPILYEMFHRPKNAPHEIVD